MKCSRCQHENPSALKFCGECGARLAAGCASCGAANAPDQKFCGQCGTKLSPDSARGRVASPESYTPKHLAEKILNSKAALEGERKQVTVLFADLKGSMELLADRDPEEARKLLDPVLECMMEAVHHYEGTVNQVMGDGIMALFGAPLAHEDHAVRACYAALRMQENVKRYSEDLRRSQGAAVRIRVGLNSGDVVVRAIGSDLHMDYTAVGQTTHLAARMEQLADPGSILLSADTLRLAEGYVRVKSLGPVPVKGLPEPIEIFELTGAGRARTRLQAAALRGLTRFVGRDAEVEHLRRVLGQAGAGRGQVVAIVGEAGVGKSRLVYEFTHSHRVQEWLILEASSVSYGKATSYLPVIDLLKGYFKIGDRDDHREMRDKVLGRVLGLDRALEPLLPPLLALLDVPVEDAAWQNLDPPRRRQRTLESVKRLLLREAQVQPLLVVFEDLHWVDGETQALLDSLVETLSSARLLLLVNYRPEYEHRWGSKTAYSQLRLDSLPAESAQELLSALLGPDAGLAPLMQMLVKRGNPFFLEETVRMLMETGALAGERGAYRLTRPVEMLQVPATVQAILAARIDRLSVEDKRLLQTAAVIGKDVPYILLEAIVKLPEPILREGVAHLQAAEFLYEASLFPDLEYTFKHALTHDVAYNGVLQERRKALHAQILEAMERLYANRLVEQVDRLGHHAFLGERWDKALSHLRQAGEKALSRSANRAAVAAFEQALTAAERLPQTRPVAEQTIDIHLSARLALTTVGEIIRSLEHSRQAARLAETFADQARLVWALGAQTISYASVGDLAEAVACAERSVAIAAFLDDPLLRVAGDFYLGWVMGHAGHFDTAVDLLTRCAAGARCLLDGEDAKVNAGPLRGYATAGFLRVQALAWGATCLTELGRFGEAIEHGREAVRAAEEIGLMYSLGIAKHRLGYAYLLSGDLEHALPLLEQCAELAERVDLPVFVVHLGSCLGQAYCFAARAGEAVTLIERARALEEAGGNTLWVPVNLATLANAFSVLGRSSEAVQTAEQALDCSRRFGQEGSEAWALFTSGEVFARCETGDRTRAAVAYQAALALGTKLKMRPLVARCHLGLATIPGIDRVEQRRRLDMATDMFRDMGMRSWLEKTESALKNPSVQ